ncbi:MAG: dTDP-4-dehydrorhamnose reductase [Chthoniobacteraceae bacterium]
MRIVIIGSGGRLGAALAREWKAAGEQVHSFAHASLDLADADAIRDAITPLSFDVLVNCAALTNVDYCESHKEEAMSINGDAVRVIAEMCQRKRKRCIHISTDYVFDGEKRTPYTERDKARPLGVYAASKLAGEAALLEASPEHLAVRMSWVFGPDRPSFVDQILQRAHETEDLSAIADKWSTPTYTLDVAKLLRPLLREKRATGVLHLANTGECTWQEYGQFAIDCAAKLGAPLKGRTVAPLRMSDLAAFVAKRPVYTVLSTAKFAERSGLTPRPWQEAVEEHVRATLSR